MFLSDTKMGIGNRKRCEFLDVADALGFKPTEENEMEGGQSQHSEEPHEENGDCLWETAAFIDMLAALLHELAI